MCGGLKGWGHIKARGSHTKFETLKTLLPWKVLKISVFSQLNSYEENAKVTRRWSATAGCSGILWATSWADVVSLAMIHSAEAVLSKSHHIACLSISVLVCASKALASGSSDIPWVLLLRLCTGGQRGSYCGLPAPAAAAGTLLLMLLC